MPQLSAADGEEDLGANDELLRFKDEGEHDDKTSVAADRDLDDVKSSLVNESETNSSSDSEADRRARAEPDVANRARQSQLFGEALRRQQTTGLFQPPPYVGYPFFMIPDLCGSYLAGGGLTAGARAYLPFQWPLLDIPGRAAMRDSATPTHLSSAVRPHVGHLHPLLSYCPEAFSPQRVSPSFSPDAGVSRSPHTACYPVSPGGVAQMPHTFDWLQGQPMYPMAGGFSPAALAMNTSMSSLAPSGFSPRLAASSPPSVSHATVVVKQEAGGDGPPRKSAADAARESGGEHKAHIKKPLNAFMLFMREERPNVVAQCQVKESATINQILGQRWHSLSKEEQARYYELARKERLLHSQLYPGWSARDNYGKKKKRKKTRSETQQDDDSSPQPKRAPVSPDEPPHVHALLTHTRSLTSASAHVRPHLSRPHAVSHLTHTHLSQASPASSVDSPATPTAALASPGAPAPTHTEHTHGPGGRVSPCAEQPLALTTRPPRGTHPQAPPTPSSDTPSPHTPLPLPVLAPPASSSQQSRRANQV
ncbi:transcription factor 7-like 1-A isoform X2 [Dunckerocampus dactyliophorus]|uniref:transcription factor 7-like 1-A isoform X2 n=1 Tax=Dunckerocampus dactyliophorus TaxID=161453 RepID=UPI002404EA96|nr:transcription factor 7-like 1-A isoform X2 [Dunckerocampus dactyliophorus]